MLGAASLFLADPTVGGPPLLPPDGHWRANSDHWVVADDSVDPPDADLAASGSFAARGLLAGPLDWAAGLGRWIRPID